MNNRLELYNAGYSDRDAADILGINRSTFYGWRIGRGLPTNSLMIRKTKFDYTNRPDWEIENMREFQKLLLAVDDEAREVGRRLTESSITDVMNYYREGYDE